MKDEKNRQDLIEITHKGIERIFEEAEKAVAIKKTDKTLIEMANYRINTVAAYTIAEQVLAVIRNNDLETAQLVYGHLKGKVREIKEGFSEKYKPLTSKLENYIIGPSSPIAQEFKRRGN